jgi:hypothetical protein
MVQLVANNAQYDTAVRSEHGWLLRPPIEWLSPLTDAQKARCPNGNATFTGRESGVVEPTGETWFRIARLSACWLNAVSGGHCVKPDPSPAAYSAFSAYPKPFTLPNGNVAEVKVGVLSYDTGHAPDAIDSFEDLMTFYATARDRGRLGRKTQRNADDVTTAFAHGVIHVDVEGDAIWFHGAIAPHRSIVEVVLGASSPCSGEWMRRRKGGPREMAGVCLVNVPAYRSDTVDVRIRAAMSSFTVNPDPDRFVTFGDGWAETLDPLTGMNSYDDEDVYRLAASAAGTLQHLTGVTMTQTNPTSTTGTMTSPQMSGQTWNGPMVQDANGNWINWVPTDTFTITSNGIKMVTGLPSPSDPAIGDGTSEPADAAEQAVNDAAAEAAVAAQIQAQATAAEDALANALPHTAGSSVPSPSKPAEMHWRAVLMVEGIKSSDGRLIAPGAVTWRNLPQPLRYSPTDLGHDHATTVGTIWDVWRAKRDDGGFDIYAEGTYDREDTTGLSAEVERKVAEGVIMRLSVDGSKATDTIMWDEANNADLSIMVDNGAFVGVWSHPFRVFTEFEFGSCTIVDIPALQQAGIAPIGRWGDRISASLALQHDASYPLEVTRMLAAKMGEEPTPTRFTSINTISQVGVEAADRALADRRARLAQKLSA